MNFGYFCSFQSLDKGIIEQFGPTGFTSSIYKSSSNLNKLNTGYLYQTIIVFIFSAFLLFTIFLLSSFGYFINNLNFLILFFAFIVFSFV